MCSWSAFTGRLPKKLNYILRCEPDELFRICMPSKGFGQLKPKTKMGVYLTYTSSGFNLQASKHNFVCGVIT
jgi:hypothetical protein